MQTAAQGHAAGLRWSSCDAQALGKLKTKTRNKFENMMILVIDSLFMVCSLGHW